MHQSLPEKRFLAAIFAPLAWAMKRPTSKSDLRRQFITVNKLHEGAENGNHRQVRKYIRKGFDVDQPNALTNETSLTAALRSEHGEIALDLLSAGAQATPEDLSLALESRNRVLVSRVIQQIDPVWRDRPEGIALRPRSGYEADCAIKSGLPREEFDVAGIIEDGNGAALRTLLLSGLRATAGLFAHGANEEDTESPETLRVLNATRIEENGWSLRTDLVHYAEQHHQWGMVEDLLSAGAGQSLTRQENRRLKKQLWAAKDSRDTDQIIRQSFGGPMEQVIYTMSKMGQSPT